MSERSHSSDGKWGREIRAQAEKERTSNQQLEPCRFCGKESKGHWDGPYVHVSGAPGALQFYSIVCNGCCSTACYESREAAIAKWNSRVSDGGVVATEAEHPHCWHCGVMLEAVEQRPRCDECSADCDLEFCNAFGCAPRTTPTSPDAPTLKKAHYEIAHSARYVHLRPVHPDIVVLYFLALKAHWFENPINLFYGQREQAKAYLYKWVETGELATPKTTLENSVELKFREYLESAWTAAAPKEDAPEVLPVPAIVHPFGPCGYLYCDWPDGELRCNEVRSTPSPDAAREAAEEIGKYLNAFTPLTPGDDLIRVFTGAIRRRCFSAETKEEAPLIFKRTGGRSRCCNSPVTWSADGPICDQCGKWAVTQ